MGDLYRPDGQLVNGSFSQRKIAALQLDNEALRQQVAHLKTHLAVAVLAAGGTVTVMVEAMKLPYKMECAELETKDGVLWTVSQGAPPAELAAKG